MTRDTVESNRRWVDRLHLPYPLLSDPDGDAGGAFGVTRSIGIAGWKIEFFRRATFLIDIHGRVAQAWTEVKIKGHALEVLEAAKRLRTPGS